LNTALKFNPNKAPLKKDNPTLSDFTTYRREQTRHENWVLRYFVNWFYMKEIDLSGCKQG
jgi:hypothetical protein